MGCAGSSPAQKYEDKKVDPLDVNAARQTDAEGSQHSKRDLLKHAQSSMDDATETKAKQLYQQFSRRASTVSMPNGAAVDSLAASSDKPSMADLRSAQIKYEDLRRMLSDIDDTLFGFVWNLFDADGSGVVHVDEFVAAMALLMAPEKNSTLDEQIETTFAMFDTKGNGVLTYVEFRSMLEATVTLNLQRMLNSEWGSKGVEEHMAKEHNEENLVFWRAVCDYREQHASHTPDENAAAATALITRFVVPGCDEEVNLPSDMSNALLSTDATYDKKTGAPFKEVPAELATPKIFADAEKDIFKLMERDAFSRFKKNPDAVGAVVDECFKKADTSNDGELSFDEFKDWVKTEPGILIFLSQLAHSVSTALQQHRRRSAATLDVVDDEDEESPHKA